MKVNKKREEEVIEGEEIKTHWDLKKVMIGGFLLTLLFIAGSYIFTVYSNSKEPSEQGRTLGVSSSNDEKVPPLPDTEDVENIITSAQNSLSEITSENLTSSQAAIQKVITDLQKLQENNGPGEVFCNLVCKK